MAGEIKSGKYERLTYEKKKTILNFTYILRNFELFFTRGKKGLEVWKVVLWEKSTRGSAVIKTEIENLNLLREK